MPPFANHACEATADLQTEHNSDLRRVNIAIAAISKVTVIGFDSVYSLPICDVYLIAWLPLKRVTSIGAAALNVMQACAAPCSPLTPKTRSSPRRRACSCCSACDNLDPEMQHPQYLATYRAVCTEMS